MTPFDLLVMLGGACGAVMVLGGLALLFKETVALTAAPNRNGILTGLKVELQGLKLSTDYPALGLFVVGLLFTGGAAWFAQPADIEPLEIRGYIRAADPSSVKVYVTPGEWPVDRQTDGLVRARLYPNLENLVCVVAAPGHRVPEYRVFIETRPRWPFGSSRVADLGVIDLGEIVQEKPRANPADIEPAEGPLPGINQVGRY